MFIFYCMAHWWCLQTSEIIPVDVNIFQGRQIKESIAFIKSFAYWNNFLAALFYSKWSIISLCLLCILFNLQCSAGVPYSRKLLGLHLIIYLLRFLRSQTLAIYNVFLCNSLSLACIQKKFFLFYLTAHLFRVKAMFSFKFKLFKANVKPSKTSKIIVGGSPPLHTRQKDPRTDSPTLSRTHYFLALIFLADNVKNL